MDKKIILLIIISIILIQIVQSVNLVNVYPPNQKIQILGFVNSTSINGASSGLMCNLHYPILACAFTSNYFSDASTEIAVFDLRNNLTFKVNVNEHVHGLVLFFNKTNNVARIYYVRGVYASPATSASYQIRFVDVFLSNRTWTTPQTIASLGSNSPNYEKFIYNARDYTILYVSPGDGGTVVVLFLNKTNGNFTYITLPHGNTITTVGDYMFIIPCRMSSAGNYDITVYSVFLSNPRNIFNHYTGSSSCSFFFSTLTVFRSYTNFAPIGTFYQGTESAYEGFTYDFTHFLYNLNRKYLISALSQSSSYMYVDSSFNTYSYFYGLLIRASETFTYNNTNYNIPYLFETEQECRECGIMVLQSGNNIAVLRVRKNPDIQGIYVNLLFNENFYYNTTSTTDIRELLGVSSVSPGSQFGSVVINIFNNNTFRTFTITIGLANGRVGFSSGVFIYFEKLAHEDVSIVVNIENTNLAPANLIPMSSRNYLINSPVRNLIYFNLQNVQDCENYVINVLAVPLGFNNYVFFRNNKFDFSCRALIFLRPFDRIYKLVVYDKNGNKVYETGGFYVTQSEYFIRINQGSGDGGTINIEDINITYSCNLYNINQSHAKHSCSVIANKQVNFKYVVKQINMFLNTSNIVCDYETNNNIVAFECEIDKSKNYNVLLYANNNIIYSDFISFQSSNNDIGFSSQENLIIILFFILVLGLITAFNPVLGLFTISIGLFILYFVGFLSINIIGLSSLVFLFAVLIYLYRSKLIYGE